MSRRRAQDILERMGTEMTKARLLRAIGLGLMCLCFALGVAGAVLGLGFSDNPYCQAAAFGLLIVFLALLPIEILFNFVVRKMEGETD